MSSRSHVGARRGLRRGSHRRPLHAPFRRNKSNGGEYPAFINLYTRLHRRPPAEADMQQYFRVSPPSVHQMVLTLERAGFIGRQPRVARSIRVLIDPQHLPELL
jgi:hypothetical protein